MAESNFRDNLSGFAWARPGNISLPTGSASSGQGDGSSNPFARFQSSISGHIPVRSGERTNEEEAYFALSRWERFLGFLLCTAGAAACFLVAFIALPFLVLKPRKFAVAFSLGSILFMVGFAILQGPLAHLKHIFSTERLPFTAAYLGSLGFTLYFALALKSFPGTLISALIQVAALISYFVAYFPGGMATLSFGSRMAMRGAGSMLPV